jgi:ribosomal protein S18 acetylase RimI-like enzyme
MTATPSRSSDESLADALFASFAAMAFGGDRWVDIGRHGVGAMKLSSTFALFSGVITSTTNPDVERVAAAARPFLDNAHPWSIQLRRRPSAPMLSLASREGLTGTETESIMVLDHPEQLSSPGDSALRVERIDASTSDVYLLTLAEGSEAPPTTLAALAAPELIDSDPVAAYIGYVGTTPVATAMTTLVDGNLAVSNIATVSAYRNRGYGRAMTAEAVERGAAAGAGRALLQCSPGTVSFYTALGFRVAEEWTYLVAP